MIIAIKKTFFLCSRSSIIANRANEDRASWIPATLD